MASPRRPRRTPRVPAAARAAVGLAVGLALLAGCADSPGEVDPTGVDELTVPTPSPDPDDFVDGVDNPWYPMEPGSVRLWSVRDVDGRGRLRAVVEEETQEVAGIEATVVRTRASAVGGPRGAQPPVLSERDFFAQDRDGNVWWLGREGEWEAGVDGGEAGILVPAEPRLGDGYQMGLLEGVVDLRAEVLEVDEDSLRLEVTSERLEGGSAIEKVLFLRDVGPVRIDRSDAVLERVNLP